MSTGKTAITNKDKFL